MWLQSFLVNQYFKGNISAPTHPTHGWGQQGLVIFATLMFVTINLHTWLLLSSSNEFKISRY